MEKIDLITAITGEGGSCLALYKGYVEHAIRYCAPYKRQCRRCLGGKNP